MVKALSAGRKKTMGGHGLLPRIVAFLLCLGLAFPAICPGQTGDRASEDAVVRSFEPIAGKINLFFKRHPKLLVKVAFPENPKQVAFSVVHFQMDKFAYDIRTSPSILYPYVAHVDVDTQLADNKPCGNVSFVKGTPEGWSSLEEAIKNVNNAACFVIRTPQIGVIRNRFVFDYDVRQRRWILREIIYPDGSINGRFMALLGVPSPWSPVITEPKAREFNKDWLLLFKGL
ncbi:MAG: hypothetical protein WCX84_00865 [Syntrophales bacterium]|jgi:hypothetical protein|nr:hypothetical protein [Syntrophales bacterium]NLN61093.1 hypothetical protein [Deltaproteobacteria bacterium]